MVDVSRTCRTCMRIGESLRDLFSVFQIDNNTSLKLADVVIQATSLQIQEKDDLPQKLCKECEEKLRIMYSFRKQALESDYELKKLILSCTAIKDEDSDNDFKNDNYNEFVNYYDEVVLLNTDLSQENNHRGRHEKQLNSDSEKYLNKNNPAGAETTCLRKLSNRLFLNKQHEIDTLATNNLDNGLEQLDSTVKAESISNTYDCIFCKMAFETHEYLLVHLMEHNKDKPFKCDECNEEYLLETSLVAHKKKYHPSIEYSKGQYKCVYCMLSFFSEEELLSHICKSKSDATKNVREEPKRFKCKLCNQRYEKKRSLLSHFKVHTREIKAKSFICDFCQKEFTQKGALKRHIELHTKDKRYKCTECPKTYSRYDQFTSHLRKHSGIKPYVCEHCDKGFTQLCSLKDHIRTHTGEAPYLCAECGKKFKNNSNLRQHLKRHSGIKPFACALCPQTFCAKGQMKAHMETHSGVHPFVCVECGAAFTKANSLKKHSMLHLGIKPFACDSCEMSFTCKDHLKRHQRKHTGEKPYRCTRCPRAFTQSNDLRKHMRVHEGQNIYPCSVCGVKFRLMRELRRHYPSHYAGAVGGVAGGAPGVEAGGGGQITITFNRSAMGENTADITINIDAEKIN